MIELIPEQLHSFHHSTGRFNLWHGPVRDGKSYACNFRWIDYILRDAPPGDLFMFGRTVTALKRNVVDELLKLLGDSAAYVNQTLRFDGRIIHCLGASDARSEGVIRGSTSAGSYYDELTLLPKAFFEMSRTRMSVKGAKGFGTTNPDSPTHWLKKEYIDRAVELGWKTFTWPLSAATFLDPGFLETLKQGYTGLFKRRFIDGEWAMAEGAIYDTFDEGTHVVAEPPYDVPDYYIIGVDYGTGNPTVFILMGVKNMPNGKPLFCAEREYYYDSRAKRRQKTDAEYSDDLKAFVEDVKPPRIPGDRRIHPGVTAVYVDPSAASFKLECKRKGLPIRDADNSVLDGIRFQATMLDNGQYVIHRRCKHTIEEYPAHAWDPKKQLLGIDAPVKTGDHAKDAERYALYTHLGTKRGLWTAAALR